MILDAGSNPCTWNCLAFLVNYIIKYLTSMMVHDDLVESLIKRRQLFYVIKIELQKPTSVGGMWMYTPHTYQIHQTAIIRLPPFAVNTWIFRIYFPLTC